MPFADPEKRRKYQSEYKKRNKEKNKIWTENFRKKIKEEKIRKGLFVQGQIYSCKICGKSFPQNTSRNVYCSQKCLDKRRNKYLDGQRPKKYNNPDDKKQAQKKSHKKYRQSTKYKKTYERYKNLSHVKNRIKDYRSTKEYKEKHATAEKKFRKTDKGKKIKKKYLKKRRKEDPQFRIRQNIRSRFQSALKRKKLKKLGITRKMLGCSWKELKTYLEKKFYKRKKTNELMTWDNYGKWHVDHIIPLSKFNLLIKEEQYKACHYKNLQPLWAEDNIFKSNN